MPQGAQRGPRGVPSEGEHELCLAEESSSWRFEALAFPIMHYSSFRAGGAYSRDRKYLPNSSARVQVPDSWSEAERQGGESATPTTTSW